MDTIAAIATPPGRGGVGIVRLSGPDALRIAEVISATSLTPRHAHYTHFLGEDHESLDQGVVLYFKAPHSFTGEDVVELQGHGGPVVMDMLLARVIALGARMARPGEFSERAFLNHKMDLTQAEAIADLINAGSVSAAKAAQRSLAGAFSQEVIQLFDRLIKLRMLVEAAIDFTDEDIDFISEHDVLLSLQELTDQIKKVRCSAREGVLLQSGIQVVIAGAPNAGKSSLLNCLSGRDSAIVTDVAGTTRDVLREHIQIDGLPLHILDTAGIRETDHAVEREGVRRAHDVILQADLILWVVDASCMKPPLTFVLPEGVPLITVNNKCDLLTAVVPQGDAHTVFISAKNQENIDALKSAIKQCVRFRSDSESPFSARRRHLEALDCAADSITKGISVYSETAAIELLAEELRLAGEALGAITGRFTADDLLGKIFSEFCIGK